MPAKSSPSRLDFFGENAESPIDNSVADSISPSHIDSTRGQARTSAVGRLAQSEPEGPFFARAGAGRRTRGQGDCDLHRCRAPEPGSVRVGRAPSACGLSGLKGEKRSRMCSAGRCAGYRQGAPREARSRKPLTRGRRAGRRGHIEVIRVERITMRNRALVMGQGHRRPGRKRSAVVSRRK